MSEYTYTQQDLVRARKFDLTLHQGRSDIIHCACVTDEALAILIAQIRAESSEKYNHKNEELTRLQQNLAAIRERLGCTGATQEETLAKIDSIRAEAQQAKSEAILTVNDAERLVNKIRESSSMAASIVLLRLAIEKTSSARLAAAEKLATSIRELLDKSHYPLAERQARKNLSEWEEAAK